MLAQAPVENNSPVLPVALPRPAVVYQALSWQGFDVRYCYCVAACQDEATYRVRLIDAADINPTILYRNIHEAFCEHTAITSILTKDGDVVADIQLSVRSTRLSF